MKGWRRNAKAPASARVAWVAAAVLGAGLLGSVTACGPLTGGGAPPVAATLNTTTGAAGSATAAAQSGVPWSQVGPGWALATVATAPQAAALYLVSPAGSTYPVQWPAVSSSSSLPGSSVPNLVAWSPSKTEVLLGEIANRQPTGQYERLDLQTGQVTGTLSFPGEVDLQYTPPDGQQLLAATTTENGTPVKETVTFARYSLTGTLVKTLGSITLPLNSPEASVPVYSPDGATIALGTPTGVAVLSNAGGTVTQLAPVPGVDTALGCTVDRWWDASTILAACAEAGGVRQLWLVPASGAAATALTPLRQQGGGANADDGDWDAWQTASGLYLQSSNASGLFVLNKQAANGSLTPVTISGMVYLQVQTSDGSRFLLDARGANSVPSLLWYDPASGETTVALKMGVGEILPFPSEQDS
jgi:hypothetical protein